MKVSNILEQLRSVSGKLDKEAILQDNKDNKTLKRVFELAYSPAINFNIKKIPEYTPEPDNEGNGLSDTLQVIYETLITKKLRGDLAKEFLANTLSGLSTDDAHTLSCIIKGDMRCGVSANTCNKIWKGLIVKPPRMGASSMNEKSLAKMEKCQNLAIELKSDGSYAASVCCDTPTMMSRNGNPINGLDTLLKEMSHEAFDGFALEGELVYSLDEASRESGNGVITKIVKNTASEEERNSVYYQVWDCVDTYYYESKGKWSYPNDERRSILEVMIEESGCKFIKIIPRKEHVTMDEANTIFEDYVKQGFEGAVLKDMDAGWVDNGKPACCVKMKRRDPADLIVVGMEEGEGKASGMMGKVLLETSCGRIKVGCGSGFSDEQRIHYWKDSPIGSIFECKYDSVTKDKKTGQESLFLPIFKGERFDKDVADSYQEVLDKQII